ncbi:hypothetical protein ACX818_001410 [Acinetobacter baumannii]
MKGPLSMLSRKQLSKVNFYANRCPYLIIKMPKKHWCNSSFHTNGIMHFPISDWHVSAREFSRAVRYWENRLGFELLEAE